MKILLEDAGKWCVENNLPCYREKTEPDHFGSRFIDQIKNNSLSYAERLLFLCFSYFFSAARNL